MKKVLVALVTALTSIATPVFAERPSQEYPAFFDALQQFQMPNVPGREVATVIGWGMYCKPVPPSDRDVPPKCVTIKMITRTDTFLEIEVRGYEIDVALFLHEMSPEWGKYRSWSPIFLVPPIRDQVYYLSRDLQMAGRFKAKWDIYNRNKVAEYIFEEYWK